MSLDSYSTMDVLVFLSPVEIEKGQLPLQLILRQTLTFTQYCLL